MTGSTQTKRVRARDGAEQAHRDRDRARDRGRRGDLRGGRARLPRAHRRRASRTCTPGPRIDPELALTQARELDRGEARGPLHGVPIGVKDIIDTADLPTEMGSPIYRGHRSAADAACVALVRAAGAVILGKTVTCEFAGMTPGITTNPHNAAHTPGGSSSGSGAAVADFMVPVAFGTQTGGSVLRPAAYCGVFGFKPTLRRVQPPRRLSGRRKPRHHRADRALARRHRARQRGAGAAHAVRSPCRSTRAPRIGLCRTPLWDTAQPETVAAVEDAAARLGQAGAQVREIVLPEEFAGLRNAARETINNYERAAAHGARMEQPSRADQRAAAQAHRDRARDAARRISRRPAAW